MLKEKLKIYTAKTENKPINSIKQRLKYLKGEIQQERISYGEIAELQTLKGYIEPDDVLLKEWAGISE